MEDVLRYLGLIELFPLDRPGSDLAGSLSQRHRSALPAQRVLSLIGGTICPGFAGGH